MKECNKYFEDIDKTIVLIEQCLFIFLHVSTFIENTRILSSDVILNMGYWNSVSVVQEVCNANHYS